MKQAMTGFHQDEENDWVAQLICGHNQHVRHNPPWFNRLWTTTETGRKSMIGQSLNCVKCENNQPKDERP